MYTPWPPRTRLSAGGWSQHPAPPWSMASHCLCVGQHQKDTSSAAMAWSPSLCLPPPCPLPVSSLTCPSNTPQGWPGLCWEGPWSEGSWASSWISASWWVRRTAVTGLRLASDSWGNKGDRSLSKALWFVYIDLSLLFPPNSVHSLPSLLPTSSFVTQPLRSSPLVSQATPTFTPWRVCPHDWLLGLPLFSWLTLIGQMDWGCCCVCIAELPLPPATEQQQEEGGERMERKQKRQNRGQRGCGQRQRWTKMALSYCLL